MSRNHKSSARQNATAKRRTRENVRAAFHGAFVHAASVSSLSNAAIARGLGITRRTVQFWLRGDHRLDLETIATFKPIWRPFFRCLAAADRKEGML
jgi:hypothetical protein